MNPIEISNLYQFLSTIKHQEQIAIFNIGNFSTLTYYLYYTKRYYSIKIMLLANNVHSVINCYYYFIIITIIIINYLLLLFCCP